MDKKKNQEMNDGTGEKPKHVTKLSVSKPYSYKEFLSKAEEMSLEIKPSKVEKAPATEWPYKNKFSEVEHSKMEQSGSKKVNEDLNSTTGATSSQKTNSVDNPDEARKTYKLGPTVKQCNHTIVKGKDGAFYCDTCHLKWSSLPTEKQS